MQKLGDAQTEPLDPVISWLDLSMDRVEKDAQDGELLGRAEFRFDGVEMEAQSPVLSGCACDTDLLRRSGSASHPDRP